MLYCFHVTNTYITKFLKDFYSRYYSLYQESFTSELSKSSLVILTLLQAKTFRREFKYTVSHECNKKMPR